MTADRPDDVVADAASADDWAPLAEALLCERPGDAVDVKKTVSRPAAPAAAAASPAPAPDPAAERALAALKAKIERSGPAKSLIADVQHRAQKCARKQRATTATVAAPLQATLAKIADDPTTRPELAYDRGAAGRDAREESDWYRALPVAEQDRLHAAWSGQRAQEQASRTGHRRVANRRFVAAVVIFVVLVFAGCGVFWHATVGAGILCGLWWRHSAPCR